MFDIDFSQALQTLAIAAVPALLGIILHEVAHGWVAERCGDPTARVMGRLTLNPVPHIDPLGLLVFGDQPFRSLCLRLGQDGARQPPLFPQPARDMRLVALAGPLTNFLLARFSG